MVRSTWNCPVCGVRVPHTGRCDDCFLDTYDNDLARADELAMASRMADAEMGDL